MCLFITILLPDKTNLDELRSVSERYKMDFREGECEEAFKALRPSDGCYGVRLHPSCDCGTYLGTAGEGTRGIAPGFVEKARKEAADTIAKSGPRPDYRSQEESMPDTHLWLGFLQESLQRDLVDHVGILLHWETSEEVEPRDSPEEIERFRRYKEEDGEPDSKWFRRVPIEVEEVVRVSFEDITIDTLLEMNEDVIYLFERH